MRNTMIVISMLVFAGTALAADGTFEETVLAPESFYNGSDLAGGIGSGGFLFNNNFDTDYFSWDGFAVSNITDNATPGWGNQYSAIPGSGAGGSSNYGVGYIGFVENPHVTTGAAAQVWDGAFITNSTYAYLSMLNGDAFSKKFGGVSGDDEDFFLLSIEGFNGGASTGVLDFYLADFRFADNGLDYIIDDWTWVDMTSLGAVDEVQFSLSSTDNGIFGMNTPAYFAIDGVVPEPATMSLLVLGGLAMLRRRK
jgi:hypothetical protein